ncbi:MAG TPA: hypothetical protein VFV99_09910 [Kofleriaceae bacterium]|nr:hypothetical protein [Kofleriaceae bacterium]
MDSSFRHRLIAANVAILFVIAAGAATAVVALQAAMRGTEQTRAIDRHLALLDRLRAETRAIATSARRHVLSGDPAEQQRVLAIVDEMKTTREDLAARHAFTKGPLLEADLEAYVAGVIHSLSADGDVQARLSRFEDELERVRNPLTMTFDDVAAQERSRRKALHAADTLARQARWAVLAASLLGAVLVIGTLIAILRALAAHSRELLDATAMRTGLTSLRREPLDAGVFVDRAVKDARDASHARGVRLRYEAQLSLRVVADHERARQVLDSLLQIAIATARSGGELVVHAGAAQGGVRFAIIEANPDTDTVVGHDPALQLCSRVVEAHGGRLGIQTSAISRTYWFTLPTEPVVLR